MSLPSRVINAKPTKNSENFCQMSLLPVSHLAYKVLDIRQNSVKNGTCAVRISDPRYPDSHFNSDNLRY